MVDRVHAHLFEEYRKTEKCTRTLLENGLECRIRRVAAIALRTSINSKLRNSCCVLALSNCGS